MKEEKKVWSKKVIGICIALAVILIGILVYFFTQDEKDFDAGKYVNTILDYTFKGSTKEPRGMFDTEALTQLENQYQTQITGFVDSSITCGVEMDEEMKNKYIVLCKDIFKSMKYHVKSTEKINADEYKVTVEYQTADIFQNYMIATQQEEQRVQEKVDRGEYQGTQEEIELQLKNEVIQSYYELLNTAYKGAQYAEKAEMVFTVKRAEDDKFALDNAQLSDFIEKIIGLGKKQD